MNTCHPKVSRNIASRPVGSGRLEYRVAVNLKSDIRRDLYLLLAFPVVVGVAIQFGVGSVSSAWLEILAIETVVGAALFAFSLLPPNLLPTELKHQLVFTRMKNELPACRLLDLVRGDHRIDPVAAANKWPSVFDPDLDGATRNSRWFTQIYQPVRDAPSVLQAHRTFLLFRDVTSGLVVILLGSTVMYLCGLLGWLPSIHAAIPIVIFAYGSLAMVVARNAGNRMVVNAVAESL